MENKTVNILFALLRGALHGEVADEGLFADVSEHQWKSLYDLAARQGVLALVWDGIKLLPAGAQPPKPLKLRWALTVEKYEGKYSQYCRTVEELQKFYMENGIIAVQMKGVGLASTYSVPANREGGDIDIYTYSADTSQMSHKRANRLADELMQQKGIVVDSSHSEKHSNFYYKCIPVENHKWFVNIELNPRFLTKLNDTMFRLLEPYTAVMPDNGCNIRVPSAKFNTLFLAYHTFQHLGSGIALHHLFDWANHINRNGLDIPAEITEKSFLKGIAALTYLCNSYLGTNVDISTLPLGYERLAAMMLDEMLYPKFSKVVPYRNPILVILYKLRRVMHSNRLRKRTLEASELYLLFHSIVWHLKYPATILNRGEK